MKARFKTSAVLSILNLLSFTVSATGGPSLPWLASLATLAYALGWIMMVIMGIKWIVADSPNERADAKKGMMYILIGLLVVRSAGSLLRLYCDTANTTMGTFIC